METVEGPAKTESSFFISLFHAQFGKRSVIVNGVLVAAEGKKGERHGSGRMAKKSYGFLDQSTLLKLQVDQSKLPYTFFCLFSGRKE